MSSQNSYLCVTPANTNFQKRGTNGGGGGFLQKPAENTITQNSLPLKATLLRGHTSQQPHE